jgi:hypothetical protein
MQVNVKYLGSWVDVPTFQKNVTTPMVWVLSVSWEKGRELYGFFILRPKIFYWFDYHNL